jgi:hypothetical protein
MSKIVVSIQKVIFLKTFALFGGKMQTKICFTIIGELYLYNNKFWSMDVSWNPWCFFSCYLCFKKDKKPKQITIGLFEALEITWQTLTRSLTKLLNQYCLRKKIIAHVKDEGFNLNAMINALKSIIFCCETLGFQESFQGYCFGHAFS